MTENIKVGSNIRPFLDEISERLWSTPSHATIMIGAGFSKNANINFPDWNSLGDIFFEKIHSRKPNPNETRYLNVLKLANEVEAAFGRPALNQILRNAIPENNSNPSDLHVRLLELPWTDVFTTNYDTLLEKARNQVTTQRFDVVINKEDLVYSEQPRIIKLHGSFPSERPFIITEEDYRKYPNEFAPFVNTVQQALIENTLCLIGFSGDDPNFLQWIGWIRDNLGKENSSKIYLVGLFDLSEAQKRLLEQRNIVLVNLNQCQNIGCNDHAKALKIFLDYLHSYKGDVNQINWPPDSNTFLNLNLDIEPQIESIVIEWKRIRESYPNWVIAPNDSREKLWRYTQRFIDIDLETGLSNDLDITFLYELNWRLEKTLFPIPNNLIKYYNLAIRKIESLDDPNRFKKELYSLKLSLLRWNREEGNSENWSILYDELKNYKTDLSKGEISFLSYEQCMQSFFNLDIENVKKYVQEWPSNSSCPEWEIRRAGIMAELGMEDVAEKILETTLVNIRGKLNLKPIENDYFLVSVESIVMVFLKYLKDSIRWNDEMESATNQEEEDIKDLYLANISDEKEDDTVLRMSNSELWMEFYNKRENESKEEWESLLKQVREQKYDVLKKNYHERWNTLKRYKCDPWNDIKIFDTKLKNTPIKLGEKSKKYSFDIGHFTNLRHFQPLDENVINAYKFLRFYEILGIPFRIPRMNIAVDPAREAIRRIAEYSLYWGIITSIRLGDEKSVDIFFDRKSLLNMSTEVIDIHIRQFISIFKKSDSELQGESSFYRQSFDEIIVYVIPEILSRLCSRASNEMKEVIFNFINFIYSSPNKSYYNGCGNLTKRFFNTLSNNELESFLEDILKIPYPDDVTFRNEREFVNPFTLFDHDNLEFSKKPKISKKLISDISEEIKQNNNKKREWASTSLIALEKMGLLSKEQQSILGENLWGQTIGTGFPNLKRYYKFAYIKLPHPKNINPKKLLKTHIKKSVFPNQARIEKQGGSSSGMSINGISITNGYISLCDEIVGSNNLIKWTQKEYLSILNNLISWWNADKEYLTHNDNNEIRDEFCSRFENAVDILSEVIFPNLLIDNLTEKKCSEFHQLILELSKCDVSKAKLNIAALDYFQLNEENVYDLISNKLKSEKKEDVIDGLNAVVFILKDYPQIAKQRTEKALQMLSESLNWRHKPSLESVLNVACGIISRQKFDNGKFILSCLNSLKFLLFETNLENNSDSEIFSELLLIRKFSIKLAAVLYKWHKEKGKEIPAVLMSWKDVGENKYVFLELSVMWINNAN